MVDPIAPGDPPTELKFGEIARAVEELPTAIVNRIMRERANDLRQLDPGLPAVLLNTVRVADATWRSIRRLALDKHHSEPPSADLAVGVPPLTRTLLDSLMTVVFLFDDPTRTRWYYRSGWRQAREFQTQLETEYGSNPLWAPWLMAHSDWVDAHEKDLGITEQERKSPQTACPSYWPNPGKMAARATRPEPKSFLTHLTKWFYKELSADSHLTYLGLARRGGILHGQHDGANREHYRNSVTYVALVIYVALLTEVALSSGLTFERARFRDVWQRLRVGGYGQDLWEVRYGVALGEP